MSSEHNNTRTLIRKQGFLKNYFHSSLQTCRLTDNVDVIKEKLEHVKDPIRRRHLKALLYILDCLLAKVSDDEGSEKTVGYLSFNDAYDIFLGYFPDNDPNLLINDRLKRQQFKELLLHPTFGLSVYILEINNKRYIVLRPDNYDLDYFFEDIIVSLKEKKEKEITRNTIANILSTMDTEWDKRVVKVLLSLTRSKTEVDELGIDSDTTSQDQKYIFEFLEQMKDVEAEAKSNINKNIDKTEERLKSKINKLKFQLSQKSSLWKTYQIDDLKDKIDILEGDLEHTKLIGKDETKTKTYESKIKRVKNSIIKERRLKLRKLGSGRKRLMDENDELFLAKCIEDKATAHGRRHDSILYLNHRVKKRDMLKIVNYNRIKRNLPSVKSLTSVYNRSACRNKRSLQSKKHIGLGLFCSKKPPKAEDNDTLLTHFCRAHKKNIIRSLCKTEMDASKVLFRSFDDKAYLCPNTSTGMRSARKQKVIDSSDINKSRKFLKYDFPLSMLNCTPGTFLFMNKEISISADKEEIISTKSQESRVIVKAKYFVGSSGTVWGSNNVFLRQKEPNLYLKNLLSQHEVAILSVITTFLDLCAYLKDQIVTNDIEKISETNTCCFRQYEQEKLCFFHTNFLSISHHDICTIDTVSSVNKLRYIKESIRKLIASIDSIQNHLEGNNISGAELLPFYSDLKFNIIESVKTVSSWEVPKFKSRIVDLTDAGPGVGINNIEVQYRMIQEVRMTNVDYYMRHHLAPGDSSQNEVERIQSYVGDAICDGGYLEWEHKKQFQGVAEEILEKLTTKELEELEEERMKFNAFKVCDEVTGRLDGAVAPDGYMHAWTSSDKSELFFWDQKYLLNYANNKDKLTKVDIPGENYYRKLDVFKELHFLAGEKYIEYIKFACCTNGDACDFCTEMGWYDSECKRIPEPYPDYSCQEKMKYMHVLSTPTIIEGNIRQVNDYNPRFNLKAQFKYHGFKEMIKVTEFSKKFIVPENMINKAVEDLNFQDKKKVIRSRDQKNQREVEGKKLYAEFNWKELVETKSIKKLLSSTLDTYLLHHNLNNCLKMKKQQKIEVITKDVYSNTNPVEDRVSSSGSSDESDDEVIQLLTDNINDDESENIDFAGMDECQEPLIVKTRSGRAAGSWRLSYLDN